MHHRHTATRAGGITARSISNFIMLTRRKKIEQDRQLQRLSAGKKNTFQGSVHPSDHATQQCEFCRNWLNTLDIRHYRECEPLRSQPEEYERVKRECRDTQHGRGVQPLEGIGGKDTTPSPRKARTHSRRKKVEKSVGKVRCGEIGNCNRVMILMCKRLHRVGHSNSVVSSVRLRVKYRYKELDIPMYLLINSFDVGEQRDRI